MASYRIIQESLTNIYKHAKATEVSIRIWTDSQFHLMIQDNGRGFDVTQNTTGFGLQGMRERTQALGGHLTISTSPGQGCQVIVEF